MLLGVLLAAVLGQAQPDRMISGTVVDDKGKPVAGARVVLYAPPLTAGKENTAESEATTDDQGRYRVTIPPLGRQVVNSVSLLVYRPGLTMAAYPYFRHPEEIVLRRPEMRTVTVQGPDGRPVAGARIAPKVLSIFSGTIADIPKSLSAPLAVTTGPDGRATIGYLTARDQLTTARVTTGSIGTQDIVLVEDPGSGSTEPVIAIRLKKTGRLTGRIVDDAGRPVADQVVEIWSRGGGNRARPDAVELAGGPLRTAPDGSFQTPDNLFVRSAYRVVVRAPGKEMILSDWMTIGEPARALPPMRLRSLRTIGGRVVDRQGKPVAGVEVFQTADGPEPTATKSGPDGRFTLPGFRPGPVFLFARGDGFRFYGQLIRDRDGELTVELTRTGEPSGRVMRMLPEPVSLDESRAMARRLIEPLWPVVVAKRDDRIKFRTLEALANADPAATLEKLESARFTDNVWAFRLQAEIAAAMAAGDPEEAATVAESIADPGWRATALIDVVDALPASQRRRKLALLDRAALHAKAAPELDQRIRTIGDAAERLYEMGEVARAKSVFADGLQIAKGMTEKTDSFRGYFASQLALVDLPAALALVRDFSGDTSEGRILTGLAFRLIERDPAEAERIWKGTFRMGRLASTDGTLTWRMAAVDPGVARRVLESLPGTNRLPDLLLFLALGARERDKLASRRALDEGLRRLDRLMQDQPERFQFIAGSLLPVVERVDPAMVPEVFWRDVASRPPSGNPRTISAYSPSLLITYLAWYDRDVAAALFEPTRQRIEHTEDRELATWGGEFLAWSLFDPRAAAGRLEKVPVSDDATPTANDARIRVASFLGLPYEARWRKVWNRYQNVLGGTARRF
jgi:Carboxypeptidase regulatory-like domain